MWMMGYNEPHEDDMNINMNMVESYTCNNGSRKLRPLVPRPPPPSRFHDHLLPLNHHHLAVEQHKREFNSQQMVVVSSRWNPTPEQLQTLEELYRRGTRTPSADEIQHITAHLRRYGKIEGKNVFYWFQNHKARERQKRRRQLDNPAKEPPFFINDINLQQSIQRKDSEVEETRNWAIPTFTEKNVQVRERTRKATDEGWIAVEEGDENDQLHRRRKSFDATWHHILASSNCATNPITLTNSTCNPTTFATKTSSSVIVSSQRQQTLELFPVNGNREQSEKCFLHTNDVNLNPRQFIEFLPLK